MLKQDLHIHTIYSTDDSAVTPEQTLETISRFRHAEIIGISDHFESFMPHRFDEYTEAVSAHAFHVGTEVNGHQSVDLAVQYDFEYYVYHCWGHVDEDYKAISKMLDTGKPVIIAHPYAIKTDLNKIPEDCLVEINNRYIIRCDWKKEITPFKNKFRWIISSDAHQPNWLNQHIAKRVAEELGIEETILF